MKEFGGTVVQFLKDQGLDWWADNLEYILTSGIGAALLLILRWLYKQGKAWVKVRKEKREKAAQEAKALAHLKDLHPYFSDAQVARARSLYIETMGQNVPPSRDLEPGRPHAFTARIPLIPLFIEEAFKNIGEDDRFYLVLADSGMGKTTFMLNLYLRYLETYGDEEYRIKLFPLSYPDVDQEVKKMVDQGEDRHTILLLDAFDEDSEAAKDYQQRLDEWVDLVKNFREVILTSRTQFFPTEKDTTGLLKVPKNDPLNPGHHQFKVMYVSPFNEEDIQTYLENKFPGRDTESKRKKDLAHRIVERSPYLMVRPMLLANIDDLLEEGDREYHLTHEIYEVLIHKWLEREAGRKRENRQEFYDELMRFSKHLAREIYQTWRAEEQLHISREALREIASTYKIQLTQVDMTSRSLLNRDAEGNVKFSHKSVLEYLLALEAKTDSNFFQQFHYEGLDVAKQFLQEFGYPTDMVKVEGGTFQMGSNDNGDEKPIHQVTLDSFELGKYPVTQREWQAIMGENPSHFKGDDRPVESVSWDDCQQFIQKLNQKTGLIFRLPTEAEWEYAAGGGANNRTRYAGTDSEAELGDYAWYDKNSKKQTHPVGQKQPNALGLYDMSGNVWEWCQDWYGDYPSQPQTNPTGPRSGSDRVGRGAVGAAAPTAVASPPASGTPLTAATSTSAFA